MHVPPHSSHGGAQQSGSDSTPSHQRGSGDTAAAIPSAAELDCSIADIRRSGGAPSPQPAGPAASRPAAGQASSPPVEAQRESLPWPLLTASGAMVQQRSLPAAHPQPPASAPASATGPVSGASARWEGFMTGAPTASGSWSWQARQPQSLAPQQLSHSDAVGVGAASGAVPRGRVRVTGPVAEGIEDMQMPTAQRGLPTWAAWRGVRQSTGSARGGAAPTPMHADDYGGSACAQRQYGTGGAEGQMRGTSAGIQGHTGVGHNVGGGARSPQAGPWGRLPVPEVGRQAATGGLQDRRLAALCGETGGDVSGAAAMQAAQQTAMHAAQQSMPGFDSQIRAVSAVTQQMLYGGSASKSLPGSPHSSGSMQARGGRGSAVISSSPHSDGGHGMLQPAWSDASPDQLRGASSAPAPARTQMPRVSWPGTPPPAAASLSWRQEAALGGTAPGHSTGQSPGAGVQHRGALGVRSDSLGAHWEAVMGDSPAHSAQRSGGGLAGTPETGGGRVMQLGSARSASARSPSLTGQASSAYPQGFEAILAGQREGSSGAGGCRTDQMMRCEVTQRDAMAAHVQRSGSANGGRRRSHDGAAALHARREMQRQWSESSGGDVPRLAVQRGSAAHDTGGVVWPYQPVEGSTQHTQHTQCAQHALRAQSMQSMQHAQQVQHAWQAQRTQHAQQAHHMQRLEPSGSLELLGSVAEGIMRDPKHQAPVAAAPESGPWGARSPAESDAAARRSQSVNALDRSQSGASQSAGNASARPMGPVRVGSVMSGRALPMPPAAMHGAMHGGAAAKPGPGDPGSGAMKREHSVRGASVGQPVGKQAKQQTTAPRAAVQHNSQHSAQHSAQQTRDTVGTAHAGNALQRHAMMAALRAMHYAGRAGTPSARSPSPAGSSDNQRHSVPRSPSVDGGRSADGRQQSGRPVYESNMMHGAATQMMPSPRAGQQQPWGPTARSPARTTAELPFSPGRADGLAAPGMHAVQPRTATVAGGVGGGLVRQGLQQEVWDRGAPLQQQQQLHVRPMVAVPRFQEAATGIEAEPWRGAAMNAGLGHPRPIANDRSTQQADPAAVPSLLVCTAPRLSAICVCASRTPSSRPARMRLSTSAQLSCMFHCQRVHVYRSTSAHAGGVSARGWRPPRL